jgi:hypothetical protein
MVSLRDGAIPDSDSLGDRDSDPFHGTIWAGDYDTLDPSGSDGGDDGYTYENPENDPESDQYDPPDLDFGDDVPTDPTGVDDRDGGGLDDGLLGFGLLGLGLLGGLGVLLWGVE